MLVVNNKVYFNILSHFSKVFSLLFTVKELTEMI